MMVVAFHLLETYYHMGPDLPVREWLKKRWFNANGK